MPQPPEIDFIQRRLEAKLGPNSKPSRLEDVLESDEVIRWSLRPALGPYLRERARSLVYAGASVVVLALLLPHRTRLGALEVVALAIAIVTLFRSLLAIYGALATYRRTGYHVSDLRVFVCAQDPEFPSSLAVDVVRLRRARAVRVEGGPATGTVVIEHKDEHGADHVARLVGVRAPEQVADDLRAAAGMATREVAQGYRQMQRR